MSQTDVQEAEGETAQPPEISADGRLREKVLSAYTEAGYVLSEQEAGSFSVDTMAGDHLAELILSEQGSRVNGLTLRIRLPERPAEKKYPTLTDQAAEKRYLNDMQRLKEVLPELLGASLNALDPYGEIPSTQRLYWEALLLDALADDHAASDKGETLDLRVYETEKAEEPLLCIMLEMK